MDVNKSLSVIKTVWSLILLSVIVGFVCWSIVALTSGGKNILNSIVEVFTNAGSSM
ncbi:MAG: hypothetical protein HQ549_06420 [Candidatus Omnitrophica bacterium]|nr:hypothetical protein [Candidatus Omnitrophota bacterium]